MTAEQIQEKLQALGLYAGEIDGKIGRMSKTAIRWVLTVLSGVR